MLHFRICLLKERELRSLPLTSDYDILSSDTVALSLNQQILPSTERVPSDEFDEPLDATIYQSGILSIDCKGLIDLAVRG